MVWSIQHFNRRHFMATLPATATLPAQSTKRERPPIIENIYPAIVDGCELRPHNEEFRKKYNVQDTHEVSFKFRIVGGDFDGRWVWGSANASWDETDGCRLFGWTKEIMGVDTLPSGFVFDTDNLVSLNCRIHVQQYVKSDGSIGNKVKNVLRSINQSNNYSHVEEPF
jgi:hypothetical protein